jgi:trimethylamine--corrinoid protein Co-methyltransferase
VLTGKKKKVIHDAALSLLMDPGISVTTPEALDLLGSAGCQVEDDVVRIPANLVEQALESAPKTWTLHDRNGEPAAQLGEGRTFMGTGVTSLKYEDPLTGNVHDFTLEDIADVARLTDALEHHHFLATPGVVRPTPEMPVALANQYEFIAMASNTTKPLMLLTADGPSLEDALEMASIIAGGDQALRERPFVVAYLNSVTPFVMNVETLDKLLLCADRGIPATVQSAPNIGATTPVTIAGTVAMTSAETLAGLVISQLRSPGTPYLAGSMPMVMDMRSGDVTAGGSPGFLAYLSGIEMARWWGLPQVGAGGSSDSKIPDEQAALEIAPTVFADMLLGPDLCFDSGALESGLTHSAVSMTMVDEIVEETEGFMVGVPVNDETLALDVIREVGIGGLFLGSPHTLEHFRELWTPRLAEWRTRRLWEADGATTFRERARERTLELLAAHEPEPLGDGVIAAMHEVIDRRRAKLPPDED